MLAYEYSGLRICITVAAIEASWPPGLLFRLLRRVGSFLHQTILRSAIDMPADLLAEPHKSGTSGMHLLTVLLLLCQLAVPGCVG